MIMLATRDPGETALQDRIEALSRILAGMLPEVLEETGIHNVHSLHGRYGGKFADYIDIQNAVITSPEHFISLYLRGFKVRAALSPGSNHARNLSLLRESRALRNYLYLFLARVYLRNYDALSRKRPRVEEAEWWIGHNRAVYGILVRPRFDESTGRWENDKSEIRHFPHKYWSIGHVLETGIVVPGRTPPITFRDIRQYLTFFRDTLVRIAGSKHQDVIADLYCEYVLSAAEPASIPMLIPELRYDGLMGNHTYRLDYCVIDPFELNKIGFELSPWSTHGQLRGTAKKTQAQINAEARRNFEGEVKKQRDYFMRYGIFCLIFTDADLADPVRLFEEIKKYLQPRQIARQLQYQIIDELLRP